MFVIVSLFIHIGEGDKRDSVERRVIELKERTFHDDIGIQPKDSV
jgi:hypothetical protein